MHVDVAQSPTLYKTLLYLIWLFNYGPLVDSRSTGSWFLAGAPLRVIPAKARFRKPPHVASLAEPRAAREIYPGPPPLPPPPALTDACVLMPPAVMEGESLVSGSAIPCISFSFSPVTFLRLMRLLFALKVSSPSEQHHGHCSRD